MGEPGYVKRKDTPMRRRIRHARRSIGGALIPPLAPPVLRMLARTWKLEVIDEQHYDFARSQPGWLGTLWHGRMLLGLPAYGDQELPVLVSPSGDGDLAALLLHRFRYELIRGSSNKSPARALREMLRDLKKGGSIVITPDGPRGPRHSMNPGPAFMSRATGFPVLPCGFAVDRAWYMKSWDRFTIPKPRARIALVFAEPMILDRRASDEDIDEATKEIGQRIIEAEERGFELLGCEKDW